MFDSKNGFKEGAMPRNLIIGLLVLAIICSVSFAAPGNGAFSLTPLRPHVGNLMYCRDHNGRSAVYRSMDALGNYLERCLFPSHYSRHAG